MKTIRRIFLTGLLISLPTLITIYVLVFTFRLLDSLLGDLLRLYFGRSVPGLGFVITILLIFVIGLIGANVFGHKMIRWLETAFTRLPLVKPVYSAARQIIDAFSARGREIFQSVVLLEYPRRGIYALGFTTVEAAPEIQHRTEQEVITVFLPTTPNPTSGFLLLVPKEELTPLDMPVEAALKLIISGGVVSPQWPCDDNGKAAR